MNRFVVTVAAVLSSSSLLLIDSTIKGGVILLLAASVAMMLRRDSAATRHLIWLVAIVAVLVVPVFSALLPEWRVLPQWATISSEPAEHVADAAAESAATKTVPDVEVGERPSASFPAEESSVVLLEPQLHDVQAGTIANSADADIDAAEVVPVDLPKEAVAIAVSQPSWNWRSSLMIAWLCGLGVMMLRLTAARVILASSQRRGRIIHDTGQASGVSATGDESLIAVFEEAVAQLKISQRVRLIIHPDRSIPLVWGLRTSRLVLPESARDWTTEQLKSVLLHELAHVKRRDTWTQLLAQIACAIYWFNPLVWFAAWRLHVERERACDDLVLNNGVAASAYAEHLLDVATRLTSSPWNQACGLAMARRSSLEGRLTAVLSQKRNRRRVTNMIIAVSLLIGGTIAVPLAMLRAEENTEPTENLLNEPAADEMQDEDDSNSTDAADEDAAESVQLPEATEKLLQWGKPVNGLRAALSRLPGVGEPLTGQVWDFNLVLQNVSDAPIRFVGDKTSPNVRRVTLRQDGDTLFRLISKEPSNVDVLLKPRETVAFPLLTDDGEGTSMAENPVYTFLSMMKVEQAPVGAWKGELRTPEVSGAVISGKQPGEETASDQPKPSAGEKFSSEFEQQLKWGKPVNGLRAALSRLPGVGEPLTGQVLDFNLVLQNVSDAPIRFVGDKSSRESRRLYIRKDGKTQLRMNAAEPSNMDVILQPREVATFPFVTMDEAKGKSMAEDADLTFFGTLAVEQARAQVWSGELRTPEVSGAVISGKQQDPAASEESKPAAGEKLSRAFAQKLKWGKTVNGLRAAMMIRDTPDVLNELFVVVQNVSQESIHIDDSDGRNAHTLFMRLDGIIQSAVSSKDAGFGHVVLQPGEAIVAPAFPLEGEKIDGMTLGAVMAANLFHDPSMSYDAEVKFENVRAGTWKGTLTTGKSTGLEAASPNLKLGTRLDAAAERKLLWGEPSNGLRAALAIRNSTDDASTPDLYLAVQNVKDVPVRLNDLVAARGQRRLTIFREDLMQSQTRIDQPTMANVLLRPREVAFLLMAPKRVPDDSSQHSKGQLMARGMLKVPQMRLMAEMTVANARPGGWTGKLATGITGAAEAKEGPMPKSETAQALFTQWTANSRLNGKIPGGQLKSLAKATSNFVGYNKEDKRVPKLAELLKRMDVTRDWTQQEAVELLDDVTDVYDNLPSWAKRISRFSISDVITSGKPLPDELIDAPWGEAHENGLRTAWLLDPAAKEHRLNTPLKSRILYHNSGTKTVFFRVVSWNQSGSHQVRGADGEDMKTVSTDWTTIGQIQAVRLAPGEFTEVIGAGIGVGANIDGEVWRNTRVGTWIHANVGDEVTFTPAEVTISGSDGRQRDVKDSEWWVTFIADRLDRDAPLPDDDKERERILNRAVADLFGTAPTADKLKILLADKSPDAMASLAGRLAERQNTVSVYGKLQSGSTTFKVLPVDPDAKLKPYLAIGPGRYKFDNGATLVIVGRGRVMDAKVEFSDGDAKSFPIKLPEQGKWKIAWKPDMKAFWIAEKGVLRIIDISMPDRIGELRTEGEFHKSIDLAGPSGPCFLDALKPTLAPDRPAPPAPPASAASPADDIDKKPSANDSNGDSDPPAQPVDEGTTAEGPKASREG